MKKTLVIGWRDGNLAHELINLAVWEGSGEREFFTPSQQIMDMMSPGSIERYLEQHGPFDEIVYCAAVNELTWIKDITRMDLDRAYGVNVFGLVETVARHIEWFGAERRLKVVAVVSDASRVAMRGSLLYGSSKTALVGVLKNMARELAPNVIVVGVSPGVAIPLGRRTTKREVAETMLFALDGPDALTGSIIEITGGK
jgi:NAD(P)-dependent dehydrogenase (short-subunit alcohol dehydrogenase family)